jgi:hypothetical protein
MKMSLKIAMLALVCVPAVRAEEAALVLPEQPVTVESVVVSAPDAATQLQSDCAQLQQEANKHLRTTKIAGSVCATSTLLFVVSSTRLVFGLLDCNSLMNSVSDDGLQEKVKPVLKRYGETEKAVWRSVCGVDKQGRLPDVALGCFAVSFPLLPMITGVSALSSGITTAVQYHRYKKAKKMLAIKRSELVALSAGQQVVAE